jgi:hypothetical protein
MNISGLSSAAAFNVDFAASGQLEPYNQAGNGAYDLFRVLCSRMYFPDFCPV